MGKTREAIKQNFEKIKQVLEESLKVWQKNTPTLAPVYRDKYYIVLFNEGKNEFLVITDEEIVITKESYFTGIASGFVIATKLEGQEDFIFKLDKVWGCNTFDYIDFEKSWLLEDFTSQ